MFTKAEPIIFAVVAASAVLAVLLIANGELAIGRRRLPSPEGKDSGYG